MTIRSTNPMLLAVALVALASPCAFAHAPLAPSTAPLAHAAEVAPPAPLPGGQDSTVVPPAAAADSARAGGVTARAARDTALGSPADSVRLVDDLWVLRDALVHRDEVPRIVERAKAMGVRRLLVQVVGRGDAWYHSDLLPPPEAITEPDRDPLGELLPLAKAAGLEVHAWVNCCLVWSAHQRPRDPRHVVNAHPEWIARMADGRPMTRLTLRERERLKVEGVFLSPAHPAVRTYIANVVREIVTRYPVDGVHLDYIRQPSVAIGYDPTSRARFAMEYGADPAFFRHLPPVERARADSAWGDYQQSMVTAIVREVRDTLEAVRPGITLSAAVLADTLTAATRNRQTWSRWLRDGLLDRAYAMCYAPMVQTVLDQLSAMSVEVGVQHLVPGIAVYNTPPQTAATKIKAARALGYPAVALYSYDSLFGTPGLWDRLKSFLAQRLPGEVAP